MRTTAQTTSKRPPRTATKPAAVSSPKAEAPPPVPARDELVRQAAYTLYEQRGRIDGYELDDWLMAEALIDSRTAGDAQAEASALAGH